MLWSEGSRGLIEDGEKQSSCSFLGAFVPRQASLFIMDVSVFELYAEGPGHSWRGLGNMLSRTSWCLRRGLLFSVFVTSGAFATITLCVSLFKPVDAPQQWHCFFPCPNRSAPWITVTISGNVRATVIMFSELPGLVCRERRGGQHIGWI